jgi:FkbM family methyltransferase
MLSKIILKLKCIYERLFIRKPMDYVHQFSGILHVGANDGAERHFYAKAKVPVIWFEPLPKAFEQLKRNLESFDDQKCFQYLLSDREGVECDFNVASNSGKSSSLLPFAAHKTAFPGIQCSETIRIVSHKLDNIIDKHAIPLDLYNCLLMDTQGAELLVLKGAVAALSKLKYVLAEAADFESYKGCCTANELSEFLVSFGFHEVTRETFFFKIGTGSYFNILYEKKSS